MREAPRSPHPVAALSQLFLPSAQSLARGLLGTPGLELTFNARGALMRVFAEVAAETGRRRVLVPAYHCPSAIGPILQAGLEPVFYRIRRDLTIDHEDLIAKSDAQTAALLVIHFFGVAPDLAALAPLRHAGVRLVEDCSHSFLQARPVTLAGDPSSDYRVYSFWKTVPSGVGGGLLRARPGLAVASWRAKAPWAASARNYKRLLEESVEHAGAGPLRSTMRLVEAGRSRLRRTATRVGPVDTDTLLRRGEIYYPLDPDVSSAAMPKHSRRIIEAADLEAVVARRRANFERYAARIGRMRPMQPLVPALSAHACPWVYPVLLEDRARIDFRLRAAGVALHTFGIYLHSTLFEDTDARTVDDAVFLAERVLCLAVHQDLDDQDIDAAVQAIEGEFVAIATT